MQHLVTRLVDWIRRTRARSEHVPTNVADAIREGVGPRVTEGPAGLTTDLDEQVLPDDDSAG